MIRLTVQVTRDLAPALSAYRNINYVWDANYFCMGPVCNFVALLYLPQYVHVICCPELLNSLVRIYLPTCCSLLFVVLPSVSDTTFI
jgi:hypothetical protein